MPATPISMPSRDELATRMADVGFTPELVPADLHEAILSTAGRQMTGVRLGAFFAGILQGYLHDGYAPTTDRERDSVRAVSATLHGILADVIRTIVDDDQAVADALAMLAI